MSNIGQMSIAESRENGATVSYFGETASLDSQATVWEQRRQIL